MRKAISIMAGTLVLAGSTGFFVATAIGQEEAAPTRTVTLTVRNGATGPAGPRGPTGPSGTTACRTGSTLSDLVINAPGGQITLTDVCIKN